MKKITRFLLMPLVCLLFAVLLPAVTQSDVEAEEPTYTITAGTPLNFGRLYEIDKNRAAAGEPVSIMISRPGQSGYVTQSCYYRDSAGNITYLLSDADTAFSYQDSVVTFPMPAKNITVYITFADRKTTTQEFWVYADDREYLRMDKVHTSPNTKVNLYVTEPYRQALDHIRVEKIVDNRYSHWYNIPGVPGQTIYSLTSPDDGNTSVFMTFFWKDAPQYSVHADCSPGNGGSVSGTGSYYAGDTVTITATPNEAYDFSGVTAATSSGSVALRSQGNGVYTFTMPAGPVTVSASFLPKWVVTYEMIGGTWSDGTTGTKTEYVSNQKKPGNVPSPGQPSAGYAEPGSWNSLPGSWIISGDRTFIYSFTPCHTVTYVIENGFWADGTNTPRTEYVPEGQTPAEIPTGMTQAEGFSTYGRWDTDPAAVSIAQDQTFTYTFAEISSYARLGNITIPGVTLQPAFASNIIDYYATVPYATESVEIQADTYHATATVEGGGQKALNVGWNDFTVTAVAEDKAHRQDYSVHILRLAALTEIRVFYCPDTVDVSDDFYVSFYVGTDDEYQEVYAPAPAVTVNGTPVGEMESMVGYRVKIRASDLGIGTHELLISYPGSEEFAPCQATCTVIVKEKRHLTVQNLAPAVAHPGQSYTVSGVLTDQWGEAAAGVSGSVDIQMNYGGAGYFGNYFTTDETGAFSCTVNKNLPMTEGSLSVIIRVGESDDIALLKHNGSIRFSNSEHEWGPWTVTTQPTPEEPGLETRVCLHDSGHTETRPLVLRTVTYKIVNGLWSHENSDTVIEYVLDGESPSYIPDDMQPEYGYGVGHWDVTPTREAVTEDRTYTFTYSHYTISFDTGGIGAAPAPMQSVWSGSSASGRPDKDWFNGAAYAEALCDDDNYTQYEVYDPEKGTVRWFLDPNDETTGVATWDFVEGDVTLYCKWTQAAKLVEAVELTVDAQAGDPIPTDFANAADFGLAVPAGTDYAVVWAQWLDANGEDPGMNFEPGQTYQLRAMFSTGDYDSCTVWFKGHNSAQNPDGTIAQDKCFALTVNGQSGAATVDNMDATTAVIDYTYTVPDIPSGQMYFIGHSLTLKDDIGINFIVDLGTADPAAADVDFHWTVDLADGTTVEKTESVSLSEAEQIPQGEPCAGCYKVPVHVAAKEMTDVVTATLKINDAVVKKNQYSVQTYARTILADAEHTTYSETLWNLARAMLIYGAKAQRVFGYRTWFPADEDLAYTLTAPTGLKKNLLPDNFGDFGLAYKGSTLLLKTKTSYRLYFEVIDPETFENTAVTLNGTPLQWKKKPTGSYIFYEIPSIAASCILDEFSLTFTNGSTTYGATVSTQDYIKNALEGDNDALKNVVIAIYDYCKAAYAYFLT